MAICDQLERDPETKPPPVQRGPHAGLMLKMEALFPRALAEEWSAKRLAKEADVHERAAGVFLRHKALEAAAANRKLVVGFSDQAGAILHNALARQMRRLEKLDTKDPDKWTKADFALEKHTMQMMRPLIEWTKPTAARPSNAPQLSDGL
jgi:hypothetical protein